MVARSGKPAAPLPLHTHSLPPIVRWLPTVSPTHRGFWRGEADQQQWWWVRDSSPQHTPVMVGETGVSLLNDVHPFSVC